MAGPDEVVVSSRVTPVSDVDIFSAQNLLNPYPVYEGLREQGGAVWLSQIDMFILTRFTDVQGALADWQAFTSAKGVMMNDRMNDTLQGIVLCSDDPEHAAMRKVLIAPLLPRELKALTDKITNEAESLVDRLVAKGSFNAATEFAQYLPVTLVSELVGLPEEGRERMLDWAAANFDCFGPMNQRTLDAFPTVEEMVKYAFTECVPGKLKPGGWAAKIWEAADRGEIRREQAPVMMNDYMGPSLDTTIFATSAAIMLLATNPDQWDILRENPSIIPNAVNEVVRIESPIQNFSRVATRDVVIDGVTIPAGSRIIMSYGAANRDPRKWDDPNRFDVRRRAMDHLGFGHGVHQCIGNNLARMEITALLTALARRVKRIELHDSERHINNVLRGFRRLDVTVH
ncbi:cytochrome P450 [Rhizorhabdus dicambivorans]|uniref:Cytochrome P450 n=1 Tax=Rhizorhabdus dicambivorans TaxID=1850238 RepID=A0A2A4FNZ4_9SPHN|nr:cytochrome P450 [Rhizorhabdus dicambivorans]ATE65464.1 cytochrome P450 [Rhizorhabdus dicambivorans]PCE39877.1 cytochrome P450 [Rhizorhabdus dicambivorans]